MARYDKLEIPPGSEFDTSVRRKDPLVYARQMLNRHAEEIIIQEKELEEQISVVGQQLDALKAARDTLVAALRGTEKLRAEFNSEELDRDDDNLVRG